MNSIPQLPDRNTAGPASLCAVALLSTALSLGPLAGAEVFSFSRPAMGTVFHIKLHSPDETAARRGADAAFDRVGQINETASDYLPESELSRLNKAPENQPVAVSADLFALVEKSIEVSRLTGGAFDITCTYAVQNWRRANRQGKLPTAERTARAIAMTDWTALRLDRPARTVTKLRPGLLLDLGGIGKGYAADQALLVLRRRGFSRALVAAGGDLAIGDPPPGKSGWDIALRTFEKPGEADRLIHVSLKNCGCSTSGDLHQFLELDGRRWSHIIDPRTGLGLTRRVACSAIAPDATTSDALATALCVMGNRQGLALIERLPGHHARFVALDGETATVSQSPGFAALHP